MMSFAHLIGIVSIAWCAVCMIGATRGRIENRPAAVTAAGLFMIAAAIAFK